MKTVEEYRAEFEVYTPDKLLRVATSLAMMLDAEVRMTRALAARLDKDTVLLAETQKRMEEIVKGSLGGWSLLDVERHKVSDLRARLTSAGISLEGEQYFDGSPI